MPKLPPSKYKNADLPIPPIRVETDPNKYSKRDVIESSLALRVREGKTVLGTVSSAYKDIKVFKLRQNHDPPILTE